MKTAPSQIMSTLSLLSIATSQLVDATPINVISIMD